MDDARSLISPESIKPEGRVGVIRVNRRVLSCDESKYAV